MDLNDLSHEDLVLRINTAYNYDATRSYADYKNRLNLLSDETLVSILRSITLGNQNKDTRLLVRQFASRSLYGPKSSTRFAAIIEQEYFPVRNRLKDSYGIDPSTSVISCAVAGVLSFEDKGHPLTTKQQHRLALALTAINTVDDISSVDYIKGIHGSYTWVNEESFYAYVQEDQSDEQFDRMLTTLCSGQKYSRFLEVLENAHGTTSKPLISGML